MKKFKINEILKTNEVKKNLELTFKNEKIVINYLDEKITEEISYNEITNMKYVGNSKVGIFVDEQIYSFFECEFVSKLQFKKLVENLKGIMRRKYEKVVDEIFINLKHPVGKSYIFLKEAIIIYAEQFNNNIKIGTIYKMINQKYDSKEECIERNIRYAIQKLYDYKEQKKKLPIREDGKIRNFKFIAEFVKRNNINN